MITQTIALAVLLQSSTITGQVRDARTHAPIAFARVELTNAQIPIQEQFTNNDGTFRFARIEPAEYTIAVNYSGYRGFWTQVDTILGSAPVIVELVRIRSAAAAPPVVMSLRDYLVPDSARKEFDRARQETRKQDCVAAIRHFEKGLRTFDKEASAWNDLGNCYRNLGQLDRAEHAFKRAGSLSDSVYVALNLADVYSVQNRFAEAARVLEQAIARQPEAGDAYYGLALVFAAQGLPDRVESNLLKAEARPHKVADVHLLLAQIFSAQGKQAEAQRQLQSFLEEQAKGGK